MKYVSIFISFLLVTGLCEYASGTPIVGWGNNYSGQISGIPKCDYLQIDAGVNHGLGLCPDGSLVCWGDNHDNIVNDTPTGNDFSEISAGFVHNVAMKTDGSLSAWGANDYGQTNVPDITGIKKISAGMFHNLAIASDERIIGWGTNYYGVLDIPSGIGYRDVAAGGVLSAAINAAGVLELWGSVIRPDAFPVKNTDFVDIDAGMDHYVALREDGSVYAWSAMYQSINEDVPAGNNFMAVSAGFDWCVALRTDGSIVAWGEEYLGESFLSSNLDVPDGYNYSAIAAGGYHGYALVPEPASMLLLMLGGWAISRRKRT